MAVYCSGVAVGGDVQGMKDYIILQSCPAEKDGVRRRMRLKINHPS